MGGSLFSFSPSSSSLSLKRLREEPGGAAITDSSWWPHASEQPFSTLLPLGVTQLALAGKAQDRTGNFRTF